MQRIESATNDKIKTAVKVAASARYRRETGLFFLEGLRLCRDAALTGYEIDTTFVTENIIEKFPQDIEFIISKSKHSFVISSAVEHKLTQAQTAQGVFCLCKKRENRHKIDINGKYIVLENVQDPANFGAVCRTAEALGIKGAVICGCCDLYNPKTQRAAMGSALRLPIIETDDLASLLKTLAEKGMKLYATTPREDAEKITSLSFEGGVLAVIGNEGNGVSEEIFELCKKITIPMGGRAESLNASMAAAITMWEMMRNDG